MKLKYRKRCCPDIKRIHWSSFGLDMTACCLCLLLVLQPVPAIRPHNVHTQLHMHIVLCSIAWLIVGTYELCKKDDSSHLFVCCGIDWSQETELVLLLLLLFCRLFCINPIDIFWCFLLFLLLHFHPLNFVSTSPLIITSLLSIVSSLSSPAMHLGIPQDMESDPDDEVKQILHHHMELLLLCRPFCWLNCRCCSKYACRRYFVPVQYLGVKDASDCMFVFLHSYVISEVTPCSAWVEMAVVLISKDLFVVVFILKCSGANLLCHTSACFPSLSSFPYMSNRNHHVSIRTINS